MSKIEKIVTLISLIWTVAFMVISQVNILKGFSGDGFMSFEEYKTFWWASLVVSLIGIILCIKDIRTRFEPGGDRIKWYLLFLFVGAVAYPCYFFMHAIKPREKINKDAHCLE